MHQPTNISVTAYEELIAIRSQDEWICAPESDVDQISRLGRRYGASKETIPSDEEIGFRVIEVPDGFTECMPVCKFGSLGQL